MLSAIGIIDHIDHIESGGIYFVLTHILGARIGATVGILYCFGQVRGVCWSLKKENRYCLEFIQFLMNEPFIILLVPEIFLDLHFCRNFQTFLMFDS